MRRGSGTMESAPCHSLGSSTAPGGSGGSFNKPNASGPVPVLLSPASAASRPSSLINGILGGGGGAHSLQDHILNSNIVASIRERSENEEAAERIEAELDEMARYIGPVAKSLFTPVVAPLVDANSFADALGVAPLYKQKESQRWTSALHIYRQMSTAESIIGSPHPHAQPPPPTATSQVSEDESILSESVGNSNGIVVGDFDENLIADSVIPPFATARQQNSHAPTSASVSSSMARQMLSPSNIGASSSFAGGFMTPPGSIPWATAAAAAATSSTLQPTVVNGSGPPTYVVSPTRRSSSMSPGEASLNSLELEAIAAVHELQFAVKDIYVSEMLPRTSELIFLNVTALEGQAYCVELTMKGWRVTSLRHDCMNGDIHHLDLHVQYFETIYAMMDRISPDYRRRFTDALTTKLNAIRDERREEDSESPPIIKSADRSAESTTMANGHHHHDDGENGAARLEQEQRQTFT